MKTTAFSFLRAHIIWVGLLACFITYLTNSLYVVSDISQFMPQHHSNPKMQYLLNEFQQGSTSRLLIISISGDTAENLAGVSRRLKSLLDKNTLFSTVSNGQFFYQENKLGTLFSYRYLLSPAKGLDSTSLHSSLRQRLSEIRAGMPDLSGQSLSADPQHHFLNYLSGLQKRDKIPKQHGVWFNKNYSAALLLVKFRLQNFDLDAQEQALNTIKSYINTLSPHKQLDIQFAGAASMAVHTRASIKSTTKWLSIVALALLSILFWWAYRSSRLFFIATLPLLSAIIVALSVTQLIFAQVHGIIIAFGITLLGVALDYPVHLFSHYNNHSARQSLSSIWPTLRLGVISTSMAYLSMLATGFSGLSQLSVFAISGLVTALLVTRWIVPLWLTTNTEMPRQFSVLTRFSQVKFSIAGVSITVLVFCSIALSFNSEQIWSKNISDLSPIPDSAKKLDHQLRQSVIAPDVNHLFILSDKNAETLLQRTEQLKSALLQNKGQAGIGEIFAVTDYIPSQSQQKKNQQALISATDLQSNLETAQQNLPFKRQAFSGFIHDIKVSKTLAPINLHKFIESPLGEFITQNIYYKNHDWISIIRLANIKNETRFNQWLATQSRIKKYHLNIRGTTSALMHDYQQTALVRLLIGTVFIFIILMIINSTKEALIILLPVLLAVAVSVSLQVMLGTGLTLFHILALLLVVGIGLDYSLFFNRPWVSADDYQKRMHGIFVSATSTIITFGLLGFSDIPVLTAVGQTVTYGVLGCFVFTWAFSHNRREKLSLNT